MLERATSSHIPVGKYIHSCDSKMDNYECLRSIAIVPHRLHISHVAWNVHTAWITGGPRTDSPPSESWLVISIRIWRTH